MTRKTLPAFIRMPALLFIFILILGLAGTGLTAQESSPDSAEPTTDAVEPQGEESPKAKSGILIPADMVKRAPAEQRATLTFMNRKITRFRANVIETPPEARVRDALRRIKVLFENGITDPVDTVAIPRAVLIRMDGQTIFSVVDEDLDLIAGETLDSRAAEAVANLELAIAEAEETLMPQHLLRRAAYALGATFLFALWLWLLRRFRKTVQKQFRVHTDRGLQKTIAGRIAADRDQRAKIIAIVQRVVLFISFTAVLISSYIWLTYVLKLFPFSRPWGEALGGYLLGTVAWVGHGIISALPGFFTILVIFVITRFVIRLLHAIFAAVEMERLQIPGIHPETANPTRRILCAAVWLLAVVVAYPYFPGSSTDAFKGVSVFIGLVISLGSTGIVNQLMSGFMLMYSRALRVGDFVHVGETEGTVLELGMLSTKVRTLAGEEVTVPNAVVISKETVNYSRFAKEGVRINTVVTIGYDTPWRQVQAMLVQAAEMTEGLRNEPKPFVLQTSLSDYYPEYKLLAVIEKPETRPRVLSQLHANIQDIFNEHGVQIMSPHYVADPTEPKMVPDDRRSPPPARHSEDIL